MRWKEELYYSRTGYYEITTSLSISNPWITKIIRRQRIGYYRLRMKLQYRTKCSPYFEYIWRGVSYNHPATTVKISRSCLYFLISYGYHTHTHTHTHTHLFLSLRFIQYARQLAMVPCDELPCERNFMSSAAVCQTQHCFLWKFPACLSFWSEQYLRRWGSVWSICGVLLTG